MKLGHLESLWAFRVVGYPSICIALNVFKDHWAIDLVLPDLEPLNLIKCSGSIRNHRHH